MVVTKLQNPSRLQCLACSLLCSRASLEEVLKEQNWECICFADLFLNRPHGKAFRPCLSYLQQQQLILARKNLLLIWCQTFKSTEIVDFSRGSQTLSVQKCQNRLSRDWRRPVLMREEPIRRWFTALTTTQKTPPPGTGEKWSGRAAWWNWASAAGGSSKKFILEFKYVLDESTRQLSLNYLKFTTVFFSLAWKTFLWVYFLVLLTAEKYSKLVARGETMKGYCDIMRMDGL